jgi:RNA recognition motif-containing protein
VNIYSVSIPRHPKTGEPYGGAFIEIDSEDHAKLLVKKLKYFDIQRVDFRHGAGQAGNLGRCPIRVLTMGKFKALRTSYKASKSFSIKNRHEYFVGYEPEVLVPGLRWAKEEGGDSYYQQPAAVSPSDHTSSTSSVLVESDLNSLAQDSVEVRRSTNPSLIRSNSVVLIEGLPKNVSERMIRVWLSHSASVQFLDLRMGDPNIAYARFASRRERDFFLKDFSNTQLSILGVHPKIRSLTTDECLDYFEEERDRRRSMISSLGPPESWSVKPQRSTNNGHSSNIPIIPGWVPTNNQSASGVAFTDTIAGNKKLTEPGSSILYGIHQGRQIARQQFTRGRVQDLHSDDDEQSISRKRLRETSSDEGDDSLKRGRYEKFSIKKTRRGKRGGTRR